MTHEEMMADDTQYCCYCGCEKARFQCCGENHFQTFAQMSADEQDEFQDDGNIDQVELITRAEDAFNRSKWVGLTKEEAPEMVAANWCADGVRARGNT